MSHLAEKTVHASAHVTVRDVRCRCPAGAHAADECSTATQAILPRRGFFLCESGGRLRPVDPNRALFFRRGTEFRMHHPAPGGDDCTTLAVDEDTWERAMGPRPARDPAATLSPATQLAAHELMAALASGRHSPIEADAASLDLLGLLARDAGGGEARRPLRAAAARTVARAAAYLAENVGRRTTLAEASTAAHCSPYHLTTIFRRATGLPLHRYHLRWRLALALERIARGDVSLQDVALEFGFSSASHFTGAFRKTWGRAPSRLATGRQLRKNSEA